jgi:hypothetical protein
MGLARKPDAQRELSPEAAAVRRLAMVQVILARLAREIDAAHNGLGEAARVGDAAPQAEDPAARLRQLEQELEELRRQVARQAITLTILEKQGIL